MTLLHVESDSGMESHHLFRVDRAMNRVVLHLTGKLKDCNLTNPSGRQTVPTKRPYTACIHLVDIQYLYSITINLLLFSKQVTLATK